ncbi:MAG: DUF3105 domain-containing protein [Anaerolineales bacterium]
MSELSSSRERRKSRLRTKKSRSLLTRILVIAGVAGLIGYLVWDISRPPEGQDFPIQGDQHIPDGTDPGPYNSNPPTSGPHYANPLDPGFYEEEDLAELGPYPHAYVVHNLEHGYIAFWYNCDLLSDGECEELKTEIREYMSRSLVSKLIAFPWHGTDVPLVLTSWGYLLEMPEFNVRRAGSFIGANRNRAPEPNAP